VSIAEAKRTEFTYESAAREEFAPGKPILSVIIDCYYRLDLVSQSIQSVLDQDYPNVELLLTDNGAKPDVAEYLRHIHLTEPNAPLIRFAENQFAWDDMERAVAICWNAALLHARGGYVCHLGYDDKLSPNYASKMVALFVENPKCVTAAPLPVSIDAHGNPNESFNRSMQRANTRGRYTDGQTLALNLVAGNPNRLFAAPGEILAIRKDILLERGGFDRLSDLSQVLKYAVLGDSGFDPSAKLYWRHHAGQLNRLARRRGAVWYEAGTRAWRESGIVELWREIFNEERVRVLETFRDERLNNAPVALLRDHIGHLDVKAAALTLATISRECPQLLPKALYGAGSELLLLAPKQIYQFIVRSMVSILPSATVQRIRHRVRKMRQA
jgi:glycosyltransferase involved in cell wall biosynthesis